MSSWPKPTNWGSAAGASEVRPWPAAKHTLIRRPHTKRKHAHTLFFSLPLTCWVGSCSKLNKLFQASLPFIQRSNGSPTNGDPTWGQRLIRCLCLRLCECISGCLSTGAAVVPAYMCGKLSLINTFLMENKLVIFAFEKEQNTCRRRADMFN